LKTIGLIGGMSWESTVLYYRTINEAIKSRLGGLHSAKIILYSFDFDEIESLQRVGDWDSAGALLASAAKCVETAGAQCLVLCTNTMHKVASKLEAAVSVPLLHIADATGAAIKRAGFSAIGLLGTRFTMEQPFYRERLVRGFGLEVIVPPEKDRVIVHRVIYEELCRGVTSAESRVEFRRIMEALAAQGAQAIVLGCTEISLLVGARDATVPLFDTTAIHGLAAAELALAP